MLKPREDFVMMTFLCLGGYICSYFRTSRVPAALGEPQRVHTVQASAGQVRLARPPEQGQCLKGRASDRLLVWCLAPA